MRSGKVRSQSNLPDGGFQSILYLVLIEQEVLINITLSQEIANAMLIRAFALRDKPLSDFELWEVLFERELLLERFESLVDERFPEGDSFKEILTS